LSRYPVEFLEEAFLESGKFPGDDHANPDHQIPVAGAVEDRHPLAGKFKDLSILCPRGNLQIAIPPKSRNLDPCAQGRLCHGNRNLTEKVVTVPLKKGMAFDGDSHIEIAGRSSPPAGLSLAGYEELRAASNSRRDVQRKGGGGPNFSCTVAIRAGGFQPLPQSLTG